MTETTKKTSEHATMITWHLHLEPHRQKYSIKTRLFYKALSIDPSIFLHTDLVLSSIYISKICCNIYWKSRCHHPVHKYSDSVESHNTQSRRFQKLTIICIINIMTKNWSILVKKDSIYFEKIKYLVYNTFKKTFVSLSHYFKNL
jgi:hypothetical protein